MSKKKPTEAQLSILEDNVMSFERNIWSLPIFSSNKKDVGTQKIIDLKIRTKKGEGRWRVIPDAELGAGGPFDDKVMAAVMKILSDMPKPIINPIDIGPFSRIRRMVYPDLRSVGGDTHADIKNSLRRLTRITLSSTYSFYDKEAGHYLGGAEGEFHFLDGVVFKDEKLASGEISDSNYIWLGAHILRNLNRRYSAPVDFDFYMRLTPDSAKSLFRLLSSSFFAVSAKKPVRYHYSTIVDRTVLKRFTKESRAKQQLMPCIQSLISHEYIEHYTWTSIPGTKDDWNIEFWPGPLAVRFARTHSHKPLAQALEYAEGESIVDIGGADQESRDGQQGSGNQPILFEEQDKGPSIEDLLDFYKSLFAKRFGHPPLIDGPKEKNILVQLTKTYDISTIKSLLKIFVHNESDEFIKKSGYSLPVFKSVIHKLIVEKDKHAPKQKAIHPKQEELIDREAVREEARRLKDRL